MTPNQWRLLGIIEDYSGHGTIEVEQQFGEYDYGDSEDEQRKGIFVTRFVVANLVRSLVKKGFATNSDGYAITDQGREALAFHRQRTEVSK